MKPIARRTIALAVLVGVLVAVPTIGAAASTSLPFVTKTVRVTVAKNGSYAVVVSLAAPKQYDSVNVIVGSEKLRAVALYPWAGAQLAFYPHVTHKSFSVEVQSGSGPVSFKIGDLRQPAAVVHSATNATAPAMSSTPYDGGYDKLVWSDDFSGAAGTAPNPSNWTPEGGGGCGTGTLSVNTASTANASVNGTGGLDITALPGATGSGDAYTSAQLTTAGLYSFTYGRIEARIKLPAGAGLCSAFWITGDTTPTLTYPQSGEVDVMEALGNNTTSASATLHGPIQATPADGNDQQWQNSFTSALPLTGGFYTYGLVWSPGRLTWTIDGVPYATATPSALPPGASWVFNGHPFHIILDLAVGGWPGPPNSSTVFPAAMQVAWVRVYQ